VKVDNEVNILWVIIDHCDQISPNNPDSAYSYVMTNLESAAVVVVVLLLWPLWTPGS